MPPINIQGCLCPNIAPYIVKWGKKSHEVKLCSRNHKSSPIWLIFGW